MADCMECDEEIDEDCKVCPGCGLEAPVSGIWFRDFFEPEIVKAREGDDHVLLANLLFKAWYEAGSYPDPYIMGDMFRELVEVYKEHQMYERLIWQYCDDYTNYDHGERESAEAAFELVKEIGREDLELYAYQEIDHYNWRTIQRRPPKEITTRKEKLAVKIAAGELTEIEFPDLDIDMWEGWGND